MMKEREGSVLTEIMEAVHRTARVQVTMTEEATDLPDTLAMALRPVAILAAAPTAEALVMGRRT